MSYVYFILDLASNAIKIGKANDIDDRISTLQTGNPNLLSLIHYVECQTEEQSFYLEKKYHKIFKHLHLSGEWFKYDVEIYKKFFLTEVNIKTKLKREPITVNTLYGKETLVDIRTHPNCFFYPQLVAQIKESYEKSLNLTLPFRTMSWPTKGKSMLLPYSPEKNRVFISAKKHQENLDWNKFQKNKHVELVEPVENNLFTL